MEKSQKKNPLLQANFINRFFFWWLKDIVWYGKKHNLSINDIYEILPEDESELLREELETALQQEFCLSKKFQSRKPSLWRPILQIYGWKFFMCAILQALYTVMILVQPLLLELVMSYFKVETKTTILEAYGYITIFLFGMFLQQMVFIHHATFKLFRLGMHVRIALSSLIFKKMLRLSSASVRNADSSLINLLTVDTGRFEMMFAFLAFIVIVPVNVLITLYLMSKYVGIFAAFVGIALMIIQTFPVQGHAILALYSRIIYKSRSKLVVNSDKRISLISELISGIFTIKMQVWEEYFKNLVHQIRRQEMKNYFKMSYISSVVFTFTDFAYRLCAFSTLLTYYLTNGHVTAAIVITITQYLSNLRILVSRFFLFGLQAFTDVRVSVRRIENFFLIKEVEPSFETISNDKHDSCISLTNVIASWNERLPENAVIKNMNMDIQPGKLYAVIGPVGSGKSSLLKLILGEFHTLFGNVSVKGKLSYASQEPWLFSGSVRDNIVFTEIFDEEKYKRVTEVCALLDDFDQLPYGDKSLVGDKGMSLSGGQCARINLARAVYRDTDVYLLDDPFSAVDVKVAGSIMKNCVNKYLKGKTRILVTNNFQHLDFSDEIVLINEGRIEFQGTFESFQKNNKLYNESLFNVSGSLSSLNEEINHMEKFSKWKIKYDQKSNLVSIPSKTNHSDNKEPKETKELLAKGNISKSVYLKYIKAGGSFFFLLVLLLWSVLVTVTMTLFDYGQVVWSKRGEIRYLANTTIESDTDYLQIDYMVYILGGLIIFIFVGTVSKNLFLFKFSLNASKNIHDSMFARLVQAPMRFFETNPSGRILNRFSEDTGAADNALPQSSYEALQGLMQIIAILLSVLIANWWNAITVLLMVFICMKMSQIYISTIRDFKRLDGIAKSPVLSYAASCLAGIVTIRSCKAMESVNKGFDNRQNRHTSVRFVTIALIQAFTFWWELLTMLLLAILAYSLVMMKSSDTFAGYVGLTLMQIFNAILKTSHCIRHILETMSHMISVERMVQFTELPKEETQDDIIQKVDKAWPSTGTIKFEHLYLRYCDDSEPVLKNLNFVIDSGQKVGIVGRTGAGKSSLITALFRLAKLDGSLVIDNIDITMISLSNLRSRISIIPQEPILFNSTLRNNIDPLGESDDATLWSALEDVELNKNFASLDHPIDVGGGNLSLGQRQLLCLARAIIRKNKILVLDEATANVDLATDELIQKAIRSKFKDCTVLTIAHRLNTIMDSDKVLVMDSGQVIEYDHPHILLQKKDGFFFNLVEKTGYSMSCLLTTIAKQSYRSRIKEAKNIKAEDKIE